MHIEETTRHLDFERGEGISTREKSARGSGDKVMLSGGGPGGHSIPVVIL